MNRIGLIACTASKHQILLPARLLYSKSTLFRYGYQYCKRQYDEIKILSAKYGLLDPDSQIYPYNETLNTMSSDKVNEWARKVAKEINQEYPDGADLYFHAGSKYRTVSTYLDKNLFKINYPMVKVGGIGKQVKFYKDKLGGITLKSSLM